jgi:HK97 family phage prohead protease
MRLFMDIEKKTLDVPFEIKNFQQDDDDFFRFSGLASTFKKDLGNDIIMPGAFQESISKTKPIILFQHNQSEPIGVTDVINENSEGLFLEGRLPKDDDLVRGRVIPQMKVGSLKTMSIGFRMSRDDFEIKDGVRIIKRVDLPEVSLVTFPMNPGAKVTSFKFFTIDSLKNFETVRQFEKALRESGVFSEKAAAFVSTQCKHELWDAADISESKEQDSDMESIKKYLEDFNEMQKLKNVIKSI